MPIYEYECKHCGKRFEKMQPVTAGPITECPNCGEGPVRRVFHPVGVIFKGSGWYINDNRNSRSGGTTSKSSNSEESAKPADSTSTAKADASSASDSSE